MRKITTSALIVCSILNGQNPFKETVMRRCDQLKGEIDNSETTELEDLRTKNLNLKH